jgi:hypothetical protein
MPKTYFADPRASIKHVSDTKKVVELDGEEVGVVFVNRPQNLTITSFAPRCFEKGDGKRVGTLSEAVDWILYTV